MKEITRQNKNEIALSEIPVDPFPYIGVVAPNGERKFIQENRTFRTSSFIIISMSNTIAAPFDSHYDYVQNLISGFIRNHDFFLFENQKSWITWLAGGGENTGKKIVESHTETNLSVDKYYGIFLQSEFSSSLKGFIARESFRDGKFIALCTHHLTNGDGWSNCKAATLEEAVEFLLDYDDGMKVFEFDSGAELFEWLAVS